MKIVWSRKAIGHLIELREHIERDSEQNATLVARRILKAVDLLQSHPEIGRPGRVVGTRELVRLRRERLELIAVFHGRQKWPVKL
jgi:toxin ParE1/3/4